VILSLTWGGCPVLYIGIRIIRAGTGACPYEADEAGHVIRHHDEWVDINASPNPRVHGGAGYGKLGA
jgi:hypothetical protein